jgi:hypothetical protein
MTAKTTLRQQLAAVLDEDLTREHVRRIALEALTGETTGLVDCPECGNAFRARLPKIREQVQNLTALLEQAEGRVGEERQQGTVVTIVRPPL